MGPDGLRNLKVFAGGCCSSEEPGLTLFVESSAVAPNLKPPVDVSVEGVVPNANGFAGSLTVVDPKVNPLLGSAMWPSLKPPDAPSAELATGDGLAGSSVLALNLKDFVEASKPLPV